LPNGKAGNTLKQANHDKIGALKGS